MIESLNHERLDSLELLNSAHLIRTRTSLLFTQQKYNLLHEANEGFAKLLVLLTQPQLLMDVTFLEKEIFVLIGFLLSFLAVVHSI